MQVVSYGGGVNSTAMLVGLFERGERPDLILFADTGGELPETYAHRDFVSDWCELVGFPKIVTVRKVPTLNGKNGSYSTLEENCVVNRMLPSIAYGYKSCSLKWKRDPQDKYVNNWAPAKEVWAQGKKITKLIGYDADEHHRAKIPEDEKYLYKYPLVEWDWGREECIGAIKRMGIPVPGKSACFFCPSSKKKEILSLRKTHPDLFARAIAMEENANLTSVKGLGRSFAWKDIVALAVANELESAAIEIPCGCFDGDDS